MEESRNMVVWFDIPVRDLKKSVQFYDAVLNIKCSLDEETPFMAMLGSDEGAILGCLVDVEAARKTSETNASLSYQLQAGGNGKGVLVYVSCRQDLDLALKEVEKEGGKILEKKTPIPPYGNRAIIEDLDGNVIALHTG